MILSNYDLSHRLLVCQENDTIIFYLVDQFHPLFGIVLMATNPNGNMTSKCYFSVLIHFSDIYRKVHCSWMFSKFKICISLLEEDLIKLQCFVSQITTKIKMSLFRVHPLVCNSLLVDSKLTRHACRIIFNQ